MNGKRIAIASTDQKLIRICSLECEIMGYSADIFSDMSAVRGAYVCCIVDTDSIGTLQTLAIPVIYISKVADLGDRSVPCIPISLSQLREVLLSLNATSTITYDEYNSEDILFLSDASSRTVSYGESSVTLTESEFKVLEYLCSNLGKTVTRQELNMLLGADSSNISDVYVCHLRKKLEALSARKLIYTERSRGYRIEIGLKK